MELIRNETVDESTYWCHYDNGTIGLVMFPNEEICVPIEYYIGLNEFNSTFHTIFSEKEFIESVQQLGINEFLNIVDALIQYSTTPARARL